MVRRVLLPYHPYPGLIGTARGYRCLISSLILFAHGIGAPHAENPPAADSPPVLLIVLGLVFSLLVVSALIWVKQRGEDE